MDAHVQTHQCVFPFMGCVHLQSQVLTVWLFAPVCHTSLKCCLPLCSQGHCSGNWWKNCLACFSSVLHCYFFLVRRPQEIHGKSCLPRKISCFLLRTHGAGSSTLLWAFLSWANRKENHLLEEVVRTSLFETLRTTVDKTQLAWPSVGDILGRSVELYDP